MSRQKRRLRKQEKQPTTAYASRGLTKGPVPRKEQFHSVRPTWKFSKMDMEGPFGWGNLSRSIANDVLSKLRDFESMTWGEILVKGSDRNHYVQVAVLSKTAQKRLRDIKQDDVDEVVSLRLTGKSRVIGIPDGLAMQILWWDPNHQVCPSKKKHT